jgi:hypothetical protein
LLATGSTVETPAIVPTGHNGTENHYLPQEKAMPVGFVPYARKQG